MSDELKPISFIAPRVSMSPSNLRRMALEGLIPSERDKSGRYLLRLNDVLAHCAAANRLAANLAPNSLFTNKQESESQPEILALRSLLAAKEADIQRLHISYERERERVERLEERVFEMMGLYNKLMAETQAFLSNVTGTSPSNWLHNGAGKPKSASERSDERGFISKFFPR